MLYQADAFSIPVKYLYKSDPSITQPTFDKALPNSRFSECPQIVTLPVVGLISPVMIRMVVVLPAALGPKNPKISDGLTERFTFLIEAQTLHCRKK